MLTVYLTCLIVGGVFVLLAALGGDGEFGGDGDVDFGADGDLGGDLEATVDPGVPSASDATPDMQALWLPIFSFKFWTFGSCFFGLTGCCLIWFGPETSDATISTISAFIGIGTGATAAWALRRLQTRESDSTVRTVDLVGVQGTVAIPIDAVEAGTVRLYVKETLVEYKAVTTGDQGLEPGVSVVVTAVHGATLTVRPSDD